MPDNKTIALGLFAAAAFGTVVCMPLSAAGMVQATIMLAAIVLIVAVFAFVFAAMNAQEEAEATRREIRGSGSQEMVEEVIEMLNDYEEAQRSGEKEAVLQEKRRIFTEKAMHLIFRIGELHVSSKEIAMVSVSKALEAQKSLMRYTEQSAPQNYLDQLQRQAETLARIAVRDMRAMLEERKDHSTQQE